MFKMLVARVPIMWCGVVLVLGWSAGGALAANEKSVTATGKAVGTSLSAQEEAREDALRQAVQQACGSFINAQTQVENYQATYDHVMSLSRGFLTSYKIEREWQDGEMSYCTVQATVGTEMFEKEWAAFAHTYRRAGYPRVVIVVTEDDDIDDTRPPVTGGPVQAALENFFLAKGVKLMDREQADAVRERDLSLAAINDDVNRLAAVAAAFNAEVVVYGQATAKYAGAVDVAGRQTHRWDITLSMRSIQTDSASILTSNVYRPERRHTSTSRGSGAHALVNLAQQEAPSVLRDLAEKWSSQVSDYRTCRVSFEPCTLRRFKAIKQALGEVRGVEGVRQREIVNEVVTAEVDWQFNLEMLAERLMDLQVEGLTFDVTEQTGSRIKVQVGAAE